MAPVRDIKLPIRKMILIFVRLSKGVILKSVIIRSIDIILDSPS